MSTFFKKIFGDFLTSTLLRAQNTTLLSKVRRRFFQILWPSQKTQTLKVNIVGLHLMSIYRIDRDINKMDDIPSFLIHYQTLSVPEPGGQGDHWPPQYLADQLTLFKPGRADYPHPLLLAPPIFFTFRHH